MLSITNLLHTQVSGGHNHIHKYIIYQKITILDKLNRYQEVGLAPPQFGNFPHIIPFFFLTTSLSDLVPQLTTKTTMTTKTAMTTVTKMTTITTMTTETAIWIQT